MTVPARAGNGTIRHTAEMLPFPVSSPTTGDLLDAALDAHHAGEITDSAFAFYVAAIRRAPRGRRWTILDLADAANVRPHGARRHVAPLIEAGLLVSAVAAVDGRPRNVYRPQVPSLAQAATEAAQ